MRYSAKHFRDGLPEWKRKKDPLLARFIYRPISFYISCIAANLNISANAVSYFSAIIAIIACGLFLIDNPISRISGAVLINIWVLLDCADGNIARSVKQQPFGEFADALSSYLLVGLMCITMGVAVYFTGGILVEAGKPWIILFGALASSSDSLMRLAYQKYNNTAKELQEKGIIPVQKDLRKDQNSVRSFQVRVETELGIAGILPAFILIAAIFNALDLVVLYCLAYYGLSCIVSTSLLVKKSIKLSS